jgi:NADPH:quinone reductase-like Zn-dependent oxidoreductase
MRVRASSLNYRDLMVLKGGGRGPTKLGVIPLSDGAGDVEAVGEGVTRVKVGDRIAGCFHARWYGGPIKPDWTCFGKVESSPMSNEELDETATTVYKGI